MSDSDSSTPLNRQALHELVHAFYADVRRDPRLARYSMQPSARTGTPSRAHGRVLVDHDARYAGFAGNVYGTHMKLEGVEPAHFERWMTLWYRHTAHGFKAMDRQRLRETAGMIGRSLFFGFFSASARFIADEQGRVRIERADR